MKALLICLLCCFFHTKPATAVFVNGLEDVPIMGGIEQIESDNISFGNEESRLFETYLKSSKIKFEKLASFYKETLPQMGWIYQGTKEKTTIVFQREGEVLEVVKEQENPLIVRITVKSKI